MTIPTLSLDGIRVLDCSRVLAGPFCGMLLADLGADVIKVEDPGSGDESRTWPPHKEGESAAYLVINRNKRDITLDLKSAEGVEVLTTLASRSDVLIENFRTGTMESFGLGYEDRKSTRLNSSHDQISYAVFCLKKKMPPLTRRRASPARSSRIAITSARD